MVGAQAGRSFQVMPQCRDREPYGFPVPELIIFRFTSTLRLLESYVRSPDTASALQ